MRHQELAGTILYTSRKPEMSGRRRGVEHFRFTRHSDGATTLRAHCQIEEPEPTVMRDVIYSVDAQGRPMDCHVRLTVDDRFMGSGWFLFEGGRVECQSYGPMIGRLSQTVELNGPIAGMGTHPIVADAWLLQMNDIPEGRSKRLRCVVPSPDRRGATPPMISEVNIEAFSLGKETVTVGAGTFRARRYEFRDDGSAGFSGVHPVYAVWTSDDERGLFLKGGVDAPMSTWYELVALEGG